MAVSGANTDGGAPIQLGSCDGARARSWSRAANTLQSLGRCLDAMRSGTANGTQVQLYDCNGTNAQA